MNSFRRRCERVMRASSYVGGIARVPPNAFCEISQESTAYWTALSGQRFLWSALHWFLWIVQGVNLQSFHIRLEFARQDRAAPMDAGAHGADGAAYHAGDLLVAVPFEVAQNDRQAKIFG